MKYYIILFPLFFALLLSIPNFSNKVLPPEPIDSIPVVKNNLPIQIADIEIDTLQTGTRFITNYRLDKIVEKQIWSIEQDTNGIMFFANKRGIITYDGNEWDFIKTPGVPYIITRESSLNTVFVGCNNSVGYLKKEKGKFVFEELYENEERVSNISKIIFTEKNIFFYSDNFIIKANKNKLSEVTFSESSKSLNFEGVFKINNSFFVKTRDNGISEFSENSVIPHDVEGFLPNAEVLFRIQRNENEVIIGTSNDKLYVFDGEKLTKFETDAEQYFDENYLVNAIDISKNNMVVSTLSGGVLIIDKQTGKTVEIINSLTGLPDDEVFSIGLDNDNGLWLSHAFGLSRVDLNIPIKKHSDYIGLEGKIISTQTVDSILYVITTEGVYYQTKPKSKKELEFIIKKTETQKKENNISNSVSESVDIADEIEKVIENNNTTEKNNKKEEGVLKKWKRKIFGKKDKNKNKEDENIETDTNVELDNDTITEIVPDVDTTEIKVPETPVNNNNYVVEPEYKNVTPSIFLQYYYKKIENFDFKCREIVELENNLLVSTNFGLYEIKNNKAKPIIEGKYILKIYKSGQKNKIYVSSTSGLDVINFDKNKFTVKNIILSDTLNDNIFSIVEEGENSIWLGGEGYAYNILLSENLDYEIKTYPLKPDFLQKIIIKKFNDNIYFFMLDGIYKYDSNEDNIILETRFKEKSINSIFYIETQQDIIWYQEDNEWKYLSNNIEISEEQLKYFKLFENIKDIKIDNNGNIWLVDNYRIIFKIQKNEEGEISQNIFSVLINKALLNNNEISKQNIVVNHKDNKGLKFLVSLPSYLKENSTQYQYLIEGSMQSWSDYSSEQIIPVNVKSGKYTLLVRAKNILGQESEIQKISFRIKPPYWETNWFKGVVAISIIFLIGVVIFLIVNSLRRRNKILEEKVKERTAEIEQQKEELKSQRDKIQKHHNVTLQQNEEIIAQRDEIQEHHNIVLKQKDEITQSINYARRIQTAVLPPTTILDNYFDEHFVINLPRDVVSGDFYWIKQKANKLVVSVADCTGHGVPGAFLSMLGSAYLNEIVSKTNNLQANKILNALRINIIDTLHVTEKSENKDGMDMALCIFDFDKKEIQFAGAYNPIYIIRNKELIDIPGDKMPVGHHRKKDVDFTNQTIKMEQNDAIYMFSDGLVDQFGGEQGRKFRKVNFKKLLNIVAEMPMKDQKEMILNGYREWKNTYDQVDDVLLMGLRVK